MIAPATEISGVITRLLEVQAHRNGTESVSAAERICDIRKRHASSAVQRSSRTGDARHKETIAAMKVPWRLVLLAVIACAIVLLMVRFVMRPAAVDVADVKRGELVASLAATGVVEAYAAAVSPEVTGRVTAVTVEEGDRVGEGDLLARLTSAQERAGVAQQQAALRAAYAGVARAKAALAQERPASQARVVGAEANLRASQARLRDLEAGARPQEIASARQAEAAARSQAKLAEDDYRRMRELRQKGAVSRADEDQARTRMETATAALRQAREALALTEEGARPQQIAAQNAAVAAAQAELRGARAAAGQVAVLERNLAEAEALAAQAKAALALAATALGKTEIRSPVTGWVSRRYVDVGDLASPGNPLLLITDNDSLWVAAEVDEEDVALVHRGQKVYVTAEALARPVEGTVVEVGTAAFPRGLQQVRAKIVRCKVQLPRGSETALLRPGMEVDVNGSWRLARDTLLIPLEALVEADGEQFAWMVRDGRVYRRKIEVGRRSYREAQVLSGLAQGDTVVVSGGKGLGDGRRVKPRKM
jgi:RND family efflux transporter MFP subunit